MKLEEGIDLFVQSRLAKNLRTISVQGYNRALRRMVGYLHALKLYQVEDIEPSIIRQYLGVLLKSGLSPGSVQAHRVCIMAWLNWLADEGYIENLKWSKRVPKLKVDQDDPRYLTIEEINKILNACDLIPTKTKALRHRNQAILRILLDTGLRESELVGLKYNDVDMNTCSIRIGATSKSRKCREVFFGQEAKKVLRRYIKSNWLITPSNNPHLWDGIRGKLGVSGLYRLVKRVSKYAGMDNVSVHSLRHTFATQMLKNGMDLYYVQLLMGHRSPKTTHKYTHLVNDDLRERYQNYCIVDKIREVA